MTNYKELATVKIVFLLVYKKSVAFRGHLYNPIMPTSAT